VDRDAIERRDFPIARRGYDPAAVDAHLRRVADEVDALRARPPAASPIAAGTSDQVRSILEAAEASAAELRADAGRRAGDRVARAEAAAGGILSLLGELEHEVDGLLDAVRQNGARLTEGLARLHAQAADLGGAEGEPPAPLGDPGEPPALEEDFAAAAEPATEAFDGDEAGARLTALNMALSGTPREETARYLADHFALADSDALLDDVYARAGR
jgi:DivIVA domain-containing protein